MYLLVEFTDNNEIAVIPDNWLNGTSCAVWPTQIRSTAKLNNAVMEKTEPDNTWPAYPIRELYKNDSYSAVRSKLKKAELESDVGTTADSSSDDGVNSTSRRSKRKRRERTFSSDEEETCIYPLNKKKNLPKPPNPLDLNVSATSPFQQILLTPPSTLNNSTGCVTSSSRRLQMPQSTDTSMSSASNICIDSIDSILPNIETMLPPTPRTVSKIMSSPSTSKIDCTARDLRMFTMLENISQEQKVQRDILNSIICRLNAADATTTAEIPEELVFPVSSIEHLEKTEEILSADNTVFKGLNQWIPISEDSSVTSCSIIPAPVMDSCLSHCSSEETTPTELFRGSQFRFQNYFTTPKSLRFSPLPKFSWADSQEVWQLMLKKEEFYIRDSNMFDRHPSLQCRMRTILLDWLIEVCEVYRLHRETYYLAMDFLDRYMSIRNNVMKQQLQLIGITSLFIAAKLEEIYPPKLTDFAYVTDGACTENEILDQELIMLKCLKWGLSPMTVNNWLGLYLQVSNIEQSNIETEQSFVYPQFSGHSFVQIARLLDLCMLDIGCLQFTYSVIAASALYHMSSEDIALSVSGYKWTDILPCVQWMSPFAVTIRETGPLELKFFSTVASDDSHNIQTHSVTVALLEKAQARHQEMLNDSGRRSPEPQDQDMAAQIITLLTPPQSDKKPLPKTGYIKSGYEAS